MDTTNSTTMTPDGADGADTNDNCENKIISETVAESVTRQDATRFDKGILSKLTKTQV